MATRRYQLKPASAVAPSYRIDYAAALNEEQLAVVEAPAAPTLVIAGAEDAPTPPAGHGDVLAARIPAAELVVVDGAGHLANVERPGPVTDAIVRHLDRTWKGLPA